MSGDPVVRAAQALLDHVRSRLRRPPATGHDLFSLDAPALDAFVGVTVSDHDLLADLGRLGPDAVQKLLFWQYLKRFPDEAAVADFRARARSPADLARQAEAIRTSEEYRLRGRRVPGEDQFAAEEAGEPAVFVDVTNSVTTEAGSGIKRVVREISAHLPADCAVLISFDPGTNAYRRVASPDFRAPAMRGAPVRFRRGDIYLDMDGSWSDPIAKVHQYRALKRHGVIIANVHHDLVPVNFPDLAHGSTVLRFIEHILAVLTFSDHLFCVSAAVAADVDDLARRLGFRSPPASVIRLGHDFAVPNGKPPPAALDAATGAPFLLVVGTVEPRKNAGLLLEALPGIAGLGLRVVLVGRPGWESPEILTRLEAESASGGSLLWLKALDDAGLAHLYDSAVAVVVPSHYEGAGLPALEALARGRTVFTSGRGGLADAVAAGAIPFDPDDPASLVGALAAWRSRDGAPKAASPPPHRTGWADTAAAIMRGLDRFHEAAPAEPFASGMQLAYISIDAEKFRRSLGSFLANGAALRSVVVVTRADREAAFAEVCRTAGVPAVIFTDEAIDAAEPLPADHQRRNFAIRRWLFNRPELDDHFVSLDDDAVLLAPLPPDHFVAEGRLVARQFFPSLSRWSGSAFGLTSFDRGQADTARLLAAHGHGDGGYAAHQPQVLSRSRAKEIFNEFRHIRDAAIDEWSLYFNICLNRYPRLHASRRTTALCWPQDFASWLPDWFANDIIFENHDASSYAPGSLFHAWGVGETADWRTKVAVYAMHYNKYYAQELFRETIPDAIGTVTVRAGRLSADGETAYALAGIWWGVAVEAEEPVALGYTIASGRRILIDGRHDVQQAGRQARLKVRVPAEPGIYRLAILPAGTKRGLEVELVVFPVAGLRPA